MNHVHRRALERRQAAATAERRGKIFESLSRSLEPHQLLAIAGALNRWQRARLLELFPERAALFAHFSQLIDTREHDRSGSAGTAEAVGEGNRDRATQVGSTETSDPQGRTEGSQDGEAGTSPGDPAGMPSDAPAAEGTSPGAASGTGSTTDELHGGPGARAERARNMGNAGRDGTR